MQAYLTDLKEQEEDKCLLQVLPAQNEISGQMGEYVSHSFCLVTMYAWTLSCISFLLVLLVQVLPGDFIRLECVAHKGTFILCAQTPDTSRYVLAAFPELLRWSCLSYLPVIMYFECLINQDYFYNSGSYISTSTLFTIHFILLTHAHLYTNNKITLCKCENSIEWVHKVGVQMNPPLTELL